MVDVRAPGERPDIAQSWEQLSLIDCTNEASGRAKAERFGCGTLKIQIEAARTESAKSLRNGGRFQNLLNHLTAPFPLAFPDHPAANDAMRQDRHGESLHIVRDRKVTPFEER